MFDRSVTTSYVCRRAFFTCIFLAATAAAEDVEKWFLMSRHGECAEIASLKRKVTDLPAIEDPASFSLEMRKRGFDVAEQALDLPGADAVQIDVAALSLYLIFVTEALCESESAHD